MLINVQNCGFIYSELEKSLSLSGWVGCPQSKLHQLQELQFANTFQLINHAQSNSTRTQKGMFKLPFVPEQC